MALGAILAAALTNHSNRLYGLFIDGVDVIKEPATTIRYAVPLDSILIEDMGPDAVSSMEFTIECSTVLPLSVAEGATVRFESLNASPSYVMFRGWVDHVDYENMDGNVGTRFRVRCTGIEAALDWCVLPNDVTIATGTAAGTAVQSLVGQALGSALGVLNDASDGSGNSSQAAPVGPTQVIANAITVSAGTTLREAIRQVSGQANAAGSVLAATVDFFGGLRYYDNGIAFTVTDFTGITVDDDAPFGGTYVAESLQYGIDAAQYRAVVVKGTGVSVTVGDGSGKAGATAVLTDSTITTVAAATAAGTTYLAQYASDARGSFGQSDASMTSNVGHPFQISLTITDARVGLASTAFRVTSMAWTPYNKGATLGGVVTFSFGGNPPSLTALTRQLTRTTLS